MSTQAEWCIDAGKLALIEECGGAGDHFQPDMLIDPYDLAPRMEELLTENEFPGDRKIPSHGGLAKYARQAMRIVGWALHDRKV